METLRAVLKKGLGDLNYLRIDVDFSSAVYGNEKATFCPITAMADWFTDVWKKPQTVTIGCFGEKKPLELPVVVSNNFTEINLPFTVYNNNNLFKFGTDEADYLNKKLKEFNKIREETFVFFNPNGKALYPEIKSASTANHKYKKWAIREFDLWMQKFTKDVTRLFIFGNKALSNKLKTRRGAKFEKNSAYGIRGVETFEWKKFPVDFLEYEPLTQRFNNPTGLALTLPYLEYRAMCRPILRLGVNGNYASGSITNEFRCIETSLLHELKGGYHGILCS